MSSINSMQPKYTSRGMLAALALLVLLMPTNYRAGTQTSHPHAFFQEMIDLVVGHTHEHGDSVGATAAHEHEDGNAHHSHAHPHGEEPATSATSHPISSKATSTAPDLPGVSELTPSAEKASAILALVTLLSVLGNTGWRRRELWSPARVLRAVAPHVEAPPPRTT